MGLLLVDIGRGTQDILLYRAGEPWENSIQIILPAPTVILAGAADRASARGEDLLFAGETMGGGPLTAAVRSHLARGGRAWATPLAAATFDDDPDEVLAMGVEIVGEEEEKAISSRKNVRRIPTGDLDLPALEKALASWGVTFPVEAAAVAVQDHGQAPKGMSDRRFRFSWLREKLNSGADLKGLGFTGDELPGHLTRMQGVRRALEGRGPLLLADTGFAALLGTLDDPRVSAGRRKLLVNLGNGHTLAGLVVGECLVGLFEHHTGRLDGASLAACLDGLVEGKSSDEDVYRDGGHGAYVRDGAACPGWEGIDVFAATGPRRSLASSLGRKPYEAAPHGQMMFTGNYGLYRAFEARWGPWEG